MKKKTKFSTGNGRDNHGVFATAFSFGFFFLLLPPSLCIVKLFSFLVGATRNLSGRRRQVSCRSFPK